MKDFLAATEMAVKQGNWYAAVVLALTLPDICGRLESPTTLSKTRYVEWCRRFIEPRYTAPTAIGPHTFLTGEDCYALRCSLLHEGTTNVVEQRARQALEQFRFVAPKRGVIVHRNQRNNMLQLQVDLFCQDMCDAVREWEKSVGSQDGIAKRAKNLLIVEVLGNKVVI